MAEAVAEVPQAATVDTALSGALTSGAASHSSEGAGQEPGSPSYAGPISPRAARSQVSTAVSFEGARAQNSAALPTLSLDEESALSAAADAEGNCSHSAGVNQTLAGQSRQGQVAPPHPSNSLISTAVQPGSPRHNQASSPKIDRANSVVSYTPASEVARPTNRAGTPASCYGQGYALPPPSRPRGTSPVGAQTVEQRSTARGATSGGPWRKGAHMPVQSLFQEPPHAPQASQQQDSNRQMLSQAKSQEHYQGRVSSAALASNTDNRRRHQPKVTKRGMHHSSSTQRGSSCGGKVPADLCSPTGDVTSSHPFVGVPNSMEGTGDANLGPGLFRGQGPRLYVPPPSNPPAPVMQHSPPLGSHADPTAHLVLQSLLQHVQGTNPPPLHMAHSNLGGSTSQVQGSKHTKSQPPQRNLSAGQRAEGSSAKKAQASSVKRSRSGEEDSRNPKRPCGSTFADGAPGLSGPCCLGPLGALHPAMLSMPQENLFNTLASPSLQYTYNQQLQSMLSILLQASLVSANGQYPMPYMGNPLNIQNQNPRDDRQHSTTMGADSCVAQANGYVSPSGHIHELANDDGDQVNLSDCSARAPNHAEVDRCESNYPPSIRCQGPAGGVLRTPQGVNSLFRGDAPGVPVEGLGSAHPAEKPSHLFDRHEWHPEGGLRGPQQSENAVLHQGSLSSDDVDGSVSGGSQRGSLQQGVAEEAVSQLWHPGPQLALAPGPPVTNVPPVPDTPQQEVPDQHLYPRDSSIGMAIVGPSTRSGTISGEGHTNSATVDMSIHHDSQDAHAPEISAEQGPQDTITSRDGEVHGEVSIPCPVSRGGEASGGVQVMDEMGNNMESGLEGEQARAAVSLSGSRCMDHYLATARNALEDGAKSQEPVRGTPQEPGGSPAKLSRREFLHAANSITPLHQASAHQASAHLVAGMAGLSTNKKRRCSSAQPDRLEGSGRPVESGSGGPPQEGGLWESRNGCIGVLCEDEPGTSPQLPGGTSQPNHDRDMPQFPCGAAYMQVAPVASYADHHPMVPSRDGTTDGQHVLPQGSTVSLLQVCPQETEIHGMVYGGLPATAAAAQHAANFSEARIPSEVVPQDTEVYGIYGGLAATAAQAQAVYAGHQTSNGLGVPTPHLTGLCPHLVASAPLPCEEEAVLAESQHHPIQQSAEHAPPHSVQSLQQSGGWHGDGIVQDIHQQGSHHPQDASIGNLDGAMEDAELGTPGSCVLNDVGQPEDPQVREATPGESFGPPYLAGVHYAQAIEADSRGGSAKDE